MGNVKQNRDCALLGFPEVGFVRFRGITWRESAANRKRLKILMNYLQIVENTGNILAIPAMFLVSRTDSETCMHDRWADTQWSRPENSPVKSSVR